MMSAPAARHDPAFAGDRAAAEAEHDSAIRRGLSQVAAINDDRLLRLYHATIDAVLRTNAFAPAAREALAPLSVDPAYRAAVRALDAALCARDRG